MAFRVGLIVASGLFAGVVGTAPEARAAELQTPASCTVGMRVTTRDGHAGTITRVDKAWSYCYVRQDDTGAEVGYLYSLLDSASAAAAGAGAAVSKGLASGVYECVGNGQYTFINMRITGPGTYSLGGQAGRYHVEGSGQIVFQTGPLKPYHSKLLSGGRIGLNANGDSFYATSCELNRNLR